MAVTDLDATLAALADPVRRRVVEELVKQPMRSGELAAVVGAAPSAMSKHLRVLRETGLVDEARHEIDSRVRIYTLRSAPMRELKAWLDVAERGWVEQLASFAEQVEADDA